MKKWVIIILGGFLIYDGKWWLSHSYVCLSIYHSIYLSIFLFNNLSMKWFLLLKKNSKCILQKLNDIFLTYQKVIRCFWLIWQLCGPDPDPDPHIYIAIRILIRAFIFDPNRKNTGVLNTSILSIHISIY